MDRLWLVDGDPIPLRIELAPAAAIAEATVCGDAEERFLGKRVVEVLMTWRSAQPAARYPLFVEPAYVDELTERILGLIKTGRYFDTAWIALTSHPFPRSPKQKHADQGTVFLLTREQLLGVRSGRHSVTRIISSGQVLRTVNAAGADPAHRDNTVEMLPLVFEGWEATKGLRAGELGLQAAASAPFAELLRSPYSHQCVLNPAHSDALGEGFVLVRNHILEQRHPGLDLRFPVLTRFDARVHPDRVVLDATTSRAVGLRAGEFVGISRLPASDARVRRRIFSFRHCVCRVQSATTTDMEKPIGRVSESVLDILGIPSGSQAIIEGVADGEQGPVMTRLSTRVLVDRGDDTSRKTGVPTLTTHTGAPDLPSVFLDLNARQALGVSLGSAVYVRPSLGSALTGRFTEVGAVLLLSFVSATMLNDVVVAVIAGVLFTLLSTLIILKRFR